MRFRLVSQEPKRVCRYPRPSSNQRHCPHQVRFSSGKNSPRGGTGCLWAGKWVLTDSPCSERWEGWTEVVLEQVEGITPHPAPTPARPLSSWPRAGPFSQGSLSVARISQAGVRRRLCFQPQITTLLMSNLTHSPSGRPLPPP